jgi:hypothetical protein
MVDKNDSSIVSNDPPWTAGQINFDHLILVSAVALGLVGLAVALIGEFLFVYRVPPRPVRSASSYWLCPSLPSAWALSSIRRDQL